ncbi:MAG: hypothetical protein ACLFPX_02065 [Candidatus Omnitrophota bacterium]
MKRKFIFMMIVVLFAGCGYMDAGEDRPAALEQEDQRVVERIEDPRLAKLILTPKEYRVDISRDPFKPLISREKNMEKKSDPQSEAIERMEYLGSVQFGDDVQALLKSQTQTGVYRSGDVIGPYTIDSIKVDEIRFSHRDSGEAVVLKRRE